MINEFKQVQLECDESSYFIQNRRYTQLSQMDILKHTSFHLAKALAKISHVCEQDEHNIHVPSSVIVNEVIPDLLIYAIQLANLYDVDLDQKYIERIQFVTHKYNMEALMNNGYR